MYVYIQYKISSEMFYHLLQMLFVITDSGQAPDDQQPPSPLDDASRTLKDKGVEIYALAVGGKVPEQDLQDIVSRPQNIFTPTSSVDDLSLRQPKVIDDWKNYLIGKLIDICCFSHVRLGVSLGKNNSF